MTLDREFVSNLIRDLRDTDTPTRDFDVAILIGMGYNAGFELVKTLTKTKEMIPYFEIGNDRFPVPFFTASFDEAARLIPEFMALADAREGIYHEDGYYCNTKLWNPRKGDMGHRYSANAFTLPLALCASCLMAFLDGQDLPQVSSIVN